MTALIIIAAVYAYLAIGGVVGYLVGRYSIGIRIWDADDYMVGGLIALLWPMVAALALALIGPVLVIWAIDRRAS